jgi:pseudouridylate synthase
LAFDRAAKRQDEGEFMSTSSSQVCPEPLNAAALSPPVVVLESTVIAQGLPWPENLQTARAMEVAVVEAGAHPLTIAILDGEIRIGLTASEIERVARSSADPPDQGDLDADQAGGPPARGFAKANRRDLAIVLAQKRCAGTTVSATLRLAGRSGLWPCVMATGGLGGVHRGAGTTFDISTDLDELSRADGSIVVCSGFKSILDLPASLEALETRGVAILGYRTSELPAFTTSSSGLHLEHRAESPAEVARVARAHRRLGLPGAIVVANPVSAAEAVDRDVMDAVLQMALQESKRRQISGKAITPFLLDAVRQATGGASLRANRTLLVANARLAAQIARALQEDADPGSVEP